MLQNFTAVTVADTEVSIIPEQANELLLLSLYLNGGENGGDVTVTYPNNFTAGFTIAAEDTIVIDTQVAIPSGSTLSFTADSSGIRAMASATLSLADV